MSQTYDLLYFECIQLKCPIFKLFIFRRRLFISIPLNGFKQVLYSLPIGDEIVAATIQMDHLDKDEVLNILKVLKPYDDKMKVVTKKELKTSVGLDSLDGGLKGPAQVRFKMTVKLHPQNGNHMLFLRFWAVCQDFVYMRKSLLKLENSEPSQEPVVSNRQ